MSSAPTRRSSSSGLRANQPVILFLVADVFLLAIEPMLLAGGSDDVYELDDDWTIVTADGSLAAHVEHTVLVGDNGPEILTRL